MRRQKQIDQLAKISAYILGRRPDEFGLVPDAQGYVKIKDFLKAINETEGFKHIRRTHINEMLLVLSDPPVEIDQKKIRARDRGRLAGLKSCDSPPSLLYTCITEKSYPAVIEKGIRPTSHSHVICCSTRDMAERIGRRRSSRLVLLTVGAGKAGEHGVRFHQAGEEIFLADFIPPACFTGPPLPKHPEPVKKSVPADTYKQKTAAGSFTLTPERQKVTKNGRKKKEKSWKKDRKRLRKEKHRIWPG